MGRPQIDPACSLRFSLSHCRRFVACAVCEGFDVGVDVEDISRPESRWVNALAFLPDKERAFVEEARGNDRRDRFFRLWTLREAFAKASGMGMAKGFDEAEYLPDPPALQPKDGSWNSKDWQFAAAPRSEAFVLAVAVRAPRPVNFTFTELVP
jgi:4'-phosphopantetheinyl transferase